MKISDFTSSDIVLQNTKLPDARQYSNSFRLERPDDGGSAIHHPTAGGRGGGTQGGRAEGAGPLPPHLQHLQGDEEGGAPLWQGGQGGQGVCAGVCQ